MTDTVLPCHKDCCPFSFTEQSEQVQNWGCLPTPNEIIHMRTKHGKTWACHSNPSKPCTGAIRYLRKKGHPYKVINHQLITEHDEWTKYITPKKTSP